MLMADIPEAEYVVFWVKGALKSKAPCSRRALPSKQKLRYKVAVVYLLYFIFSSVTPV